MKYVVRYAHLENILVSIGEQVTNTQPIAIMGDTPQYARHLHIDCRESCSDLGVSPNMLWRLSQTDNMKSINTNSKKQLDYFIDYNLFCFEPYITTKYNDTEYKKVRGVPHPAYDIVPKDRHNKFGGHSTIHWNRSMVGKVIAIGYDENPVTKQGYGKYLIIEFVV